MGSTRTAKSAALRSSSLCFLLPVTLGVRLNGEKHGNAGRYYPCGPFPFYCLCPRGPGMHPGGSVSTLGMDTPARVPRVSTCRHCSRSSAIMGRHGVSSHPLGKHLPQNFGRDHVHRHVCQLLGEQARLFRRPAAGVHNRVYTVRLDRVGELVHRET
jgi:hypothetical protein